MAEDVRALRGPSGSLPTSLVLGHPGPSQPGRIFSERLSVSLWVAPHLSVVSSLYTWDGTRIPCSLETPDWAVLPSTAGSGKMAQSFVSSHRVRGAPGSHLQALWFSQPPISSDGITDHRGATFLKFLFLRKKWLPCHDP